MCQAEWTRECLASNWLGRIVAGVPRLFSASSVDLRLLVYGMRLREAVMSLVGVGKTGLLIRSIAKYFKIL